LFHELDDLSDANLEVIDAACDRFAAAWKAGESPRLEDAIQQFGEPLRMLATIELVELTMSLRIQAGESPAIDEYVEKFPQWAYELRSRIQMGSMPNKDASAKKSAVFAIRGYEILGEIGRGGMGMVYKARDLDLGRIVAIKIATTGINVSAAERARFRTEVEAVAKLQHPNVVQVFESGDAGDIPYFTMEYVAGGDLAGLMARSPISATESAQLLELLARAVQCAHEAGIIHCDLKPSNVLLHENKDSASNSNKPATSRLSSSSHRKPSTVGGLFPKLTDFGLAKQLEMHQSQTVSGTIVGTPSYMSPEQSLGNPMEIGPATDIYSLGAILYEALVGRPPFRGADYVETLNQVRSQSPLPPKKLQPQLPRDLETICLKCLEKSPGQRYASALDLADDLSRFNQGLPIVARPIGWLEKGTRWAQRRPVLAGLLVAIATLLIAVITIPSLMAWRLDVALRQSDDNARQARDNETKAQDALKQAVALSRESQSRCGGNANFNGNQCRDQQQFA
jgi:serine/threonine protein kinase